MTEGRPQTQVGSVMQIAWVLSVVNARKIKGAPSNTGRICYETVHVPNLGI